MEFPQWVRDRVLARQGRLHAFERLQGPSTALLVVDMQNWFVAEGFTLGNPAARAIVPAIGRLADAVRAAGGLVAWVVTAADGAEHFWSHQHRDLLSPERSAARLSGLARGSAGYALAAGLAPHPADLTVEKRFYSAFAQNAELAPALRRRGIDTLLVAGTMTNVCCDSTARDAMMLDFRTVMVPDCLSARSEAEHRAALETFYLYFGDVLESSEVEARLRSGAASG